VAPREVECSTNHPTPRDKVLPNDKDCQVQPLNDFEDEGDSMDTQAALGYSIQWRKPTNAKRQSGSSSSQSEEIHFKRRKTNLDLGPTYCDPNAEFPLNSDFLGDVPDSSIPLLPYNEVLIPSPENHYPFIIIIILVALTSIQDKGADQSLGRDNDISSDIRVPTIEELEAYSLPVKEAQNAQSVLQPVGSPCLKGTTLNLCLPIIIFSL
jgi:hypothetical protein